MAEVMAKECPCDGSDYANNDDHGDGDGDAENDNDNNVMGTIESMDERSNIKSLAFECVAQKRFGRNLIEKSIRQSHNSIFQTFQRLNS